MSMSKKSRALLTAESQSEWGKYQFDMAEAHNEFMEAEAKAAKKASKRSGWSKLIGTIAFMATAYFLPSSYGLVARTLLSTGAQAAAGLATQWGQKQLWGDVELGKTKEDFMGDIHDPKYGGTSADIEKERFGGEIDRGISALDAYNKDAYGGTLLESIGAGSSYFGQQVTAGAQYDKGKKRR